MCWMIPFLIAFAVLVVLTGRSALSKLIAVAVSAVMIVGFFAVDAKFWGVVAMGASVMIFFALPWIDNSPVKSIRYRPGWHKVVYAVFVVVFVVLGYFGVQAPSPVSERISQIGTLIYFGFFLLMPWWSTMGNVQAGARSRHFFAH